MPTKWNLMSSIGSSIQDSMREMVNKNNKCNNNNRLLRISIPTGITRERKILMITITIDFINSIEGKRSCI